MFCLPEEHSNIDKSLVSESPKIIAGCYSVRKAVTAADKESW